MLARIRDQLMIYFVDNLGCLLDYLRKHQTRLQPPQMTEMVRQVAYAMTYLESRNFIHRDLVS